MRNWVWYMYRGVGVWRYMYGVWGHEGMEYGLWKHGGMGGEIM